MEFDLRSSIVGRAIGNIERRAERGDYRKLHNIYVDHGILAELSDKQNQVIYGRRGVGKTHLFYYYRDHLLSTNKSPILFQIHDCRRIGSGLNLTSINPAVIAAMMYRELLNDIATASFEALDTIENNTSAKRNGGSAILAFQNTITSGSF